MPDRRQFVIVSGTAALVTACGGGEPTNPLGAGGGGGGGGGGAAEVRAPLPAVGETIAITGGGKPIAVTRTSATTVVAVSRICTHQGCTVNLPRTQLGNLNCPCHGSAFTVSGSVVNGPATAPLQSFPARIEGNEVVVTVS